MGKVTGLIFPAPAPEKDEFICPHCGKAYQSAAALDRHVKDKHPGPPAGERGDE